MAVNKETLLAEYNTGKSIRAMAAEYGVSASYIGAVLKSMPDYKPRHRHSNVKTATLIKMRDEGKTYRQIAAEVGMNVSAVFNRIKNSEAKRGK